MYPDQTQFRKNVIVDTAKSMGYRSPDFVPLIAKDARVKIGTYDLSASIEAVKPKMNTEVVNTMESAPVAAAQMQSIVNDEHNYAKVDPTFVPWGAFTDVVKIIKSEMFYPVYISGLSGNGKTFMVEQAAAKLGREFIRVQINPETDEDD